MGRFNEHLAQAFGTAIDEGMGDAITFAGVPIKGCVVEELERTTEVNARGQSIEVINGLLTISWKTWDALSMAKGNTLEGSFGTARIVSIPDRSRALATFRIQGVAQ